MDEVELEEGWEVELKLIVKMGECEGSLELDFVEMIEGVIDLEKFDILEIMMFCLCVDVIDIKMFFEEIVEFVICVGRICVLVFEE